MYVANIVEIDRILMHLQTKLPNHVFKCNQGAEKLYFQNVTNGVLIRIFDTSKGDYIEIVI